jgi:hypothetical protein
MNKNDGKKIFTGGDVGNGKIVVEENVRNDEEIDVTSMRWNQQNRSIHQTLPDLNRTQNRTKKKKNT